MPEILKIIIGIIAVVLIILVVAGIELRTQVGRYQAFWERQNSLPIKDGELLYVALGDSTAQGIGASQPQKGYVGLIANELSARTGNPVHTINLSKTGAKIDDVLMRQLPLMEKINIDAETVITIEIGANDIGSFEADKFEKQIDELLSKLPKQAIISDIPYFGGGLHSRLEPNVIRANDIMHRLAGKHGFKLAFLHEHTSDDDWFKDYAIDRFHPSNHNYQTRWVPAFLEQL